MSHRHVTQASPSEGSVIEVNGSQLLVQRVWQTRQQNPHIVLSEVVPAARTGSAEGELDVSHSSTPTARHSDINRCAGRLSYFSNGTFQYVSLINFAQLSIRMP